MEKRVIDRTDWDGYYKRPYKTASYSRTITGHYLLRELKKIAQTRPLSIAELGGGNSCFFQLIMDRLKPESYTIVDNNQIGLQKFQERFSHLGHVHALYGDVLKDIECEKKFDVVFSVGLIEHFDKTGTAKSIETHFSLLKKGGYLIITYPTPTILYRITRFFAEKLGLWIFHDERPLVREEVETELLKQGEIVNFFVNYPIFLTQGIFVVKKKRP